jgi:diaminopimelate decarboxylase
MSIPLHEINSIIDIMRNEKTQNPFYLYDFNQILDNYQNFDRIFNEKFLFSNFFAVKALPNPHILKELYYNGFNCFDASSIEELELLKFAGIPLDKSNVFFTSNYSSKEQLEKAAELGVIMNFDSYEQFETFFETGVEINHLCFRLNPNMESESAEISNCFSGSTTKFGINEDEYVEKYMKALNLFEDSMSDDDFCELKLGIHIMPGSNILDKTHWEILVKKVISIMKMFYDRDFIIDFINFGGGIGIPYKPEETKVNLEKIASYIKDGLCEYYKYIGENTNVMIYMENGRFITGPYGWFVTNLQSYKKYTNDLFYGLNASMADLMRPGMYNAYHDIKIFRGFRELKPDSKDEIANVVGTLCENNDWFAKKRNLSMNATIGDTFIISNCGAHCRAMGFNYNSKCRPQEWMIQNNGEIKKIRREETFDDLVSTIITLDNKHNKNSSNRLISLISFPYILLYILLFLGYLLISHHIVN